MIVTILLSLVTGLVLCVCAVCLFTPYRFYSRRVRNMINKLPGPKGIPFFGNVFEFNLKHEEILPKATELLKNHGPVYNVWMLGMPNIFLNDPDDIEVIVNNKKHMDKSEVYRFLHPWFGTGLLTSTGSKWQRRRRILTPAFHFKVLDDYVHVFNSNSAVLVDILRTRETVEIIKLVSLCTLDIICETAMGTSVNAQKGGDAEYIAAVNRMGQLFQHRYMSFWIYQDVVFNLTPSARDQKKALKILHSFTRKVIVQRRAEYRAKVAAAAEDQTQGTVQQKQKKLTFLDLLIDVSERDGSLNDADIQEEVDTFMFEGHDTTAVAISWTLFLLGHHPDIQDRVCTELREIFDGDSRPATTADLTAMRYLEQVIKEALRLYPSVPAISRNLTQDAVLKNYTVPPGVTIIILPYLVHRNPDIFPDPDRFDPDRFSPANSVGRHPFAYIPFSAGPRNCIGQKFAMMEDKVVISSILRNFRVKSLDRKEDIKVLTEMVLTPKDGLRIKLEPRS